MNVNQPQHSYEEIRDVVIYIMQNAHTNGVNEFGKLSDLTALALYKRDGVAQSRRSFSHGASAQLHPKDSEIMLEIVWDLFRQGVITLGLDTANPGWPWLRLSRFGQQVLHGQSPFRFHDTSGFLKILHAEVPDISSEAIVYLEEAVATFYADCLLSSCVMLGVAAETEFLRLIVVVTKSATHGARFAPLNNLTFIRQKITKFQDLLKPIIGTLPKTATEDLDTYLNPIQSVIRIARNDAGHPTGAKPPLREQVCVWLQLFIPFARQLMRLR